MPVIPLPPLPPPPPLPSQPAPSIEGDCRVSCINWPYQQCEVSIFFPVCWFFVIFRTHPFSSGIVLLSCTVNYFPLYCLSDASFPLWFFFSSLTFLLLSTISLKLFSCVMPLYNLVFSEQVFWNLSSFLLPLWSLFSTKLPLWNFFSSLSTLFLSDTMFLVVIFSSLSLLASLLSPQ